MTEVSLEELKRAVEAYAALSHDYWAAQAGGSVYAAKLANARADAWRTAFAWLEWHHGPAGEDDYREGMALVEKLK